MLAHAGRRDATAVVRLMGETHLHLESSVVPKAVRHHIRKAG